MNLIDKDSVVATIKKHLEEERHSYFCKCLLSEIDSLNVEEQPSLPSGLDEAAEEYAYTNWEDNDYHTGASEGLPFDAIGHTEKCFRAGAEWMAGQGITFEGKASRRYENGLAGFVSWILFDQQKAAHLLVNQGEEADVIINIRKK